jgi:hypothetical protein
MLSLALASFSAGALAMESGWLPLRDQNPFVLGSGLPLLPPPSAHAGEWIVDASIVESNTELISSTSGRRPGDPGIHVLFGAETRESRLSLAYALDEHWVARASLGDEWIGVGFLDKPIQHFHKLIGAPRGFRGGRLGVSPPAIRVARDGETLYSLDKPGQALAPLLLDVTRTWDAPDARYGVSFGAKLPTGDTKRLSDTGDTSVSMAGFGEWKVYDSIRIGARLGYLYAHGNDVLPTLARNSVPFGDVYVRAPLIGGWDGEVQYDAHGALYSHGPIFLGHAGVFTIGLTHPVFAHSELLLGVGEDVPIGHTQDVSLLVALRYRPGG